MLLPLQQSGSLTHFGLFTLSVTLILCSLNNVASAQLISARGISGARPSARIYYIETTLTDLCTGPCLTLSQFAANSSIDLHSNTTLVFLPGRHYLNRVNLTLSNVDNFVMKSENSTAQIKCTSNLHIHFSQSQRIRITNLEFIGCGGNQMRHIEEFVVEDTIFKGTIFKDLENSQAALELIETTAQIVNSSFVSNGGSRKMYYVANLDVVMIGYYLCGGAIFSTNSTVNISQSQFKQNRADYGGVIFAEQRSIISMSGNIITNNYANQNGGVLYSSHSTIMLQTNEFYNNSATSGGVLVSYSSNIKIEASNFYHNSATIGGVLQCPNRATFRIYNPHNIIQSGESVITIEESLFHENTATNGGVLDSVSSIIAIEASEFHNNSATNQGGVFHSSSNNITIGNSSFIKNSSPIGAVIYATGGSNILCQNSILLSDNSADNYALIFMSESRLTADDIETINNLGSLVAFNCNVTFIGSATFANNQPPQTITNNFQEGGAITVFQSNVFFDGECDFVNNSAENGGAIHSTDSKLYVSNHVTIADNTASLSGGGVYLLNSELNCQEKSTFVLFHNTAIYKGGGLHAISSLIKATSSAVISEGIFYIPQFTGTRVSFTQNSAAKGGGLSLEANAQLYILKYDAIYYNVDDSNKIINFMANSADYGGAVYVDDDTNSGTCTTNPRTECFFQVLAIHTIESNYITTLNIYFSRNYANTSGSTLYGGLLDRCAVSQFAEVRNKHNPFKGNGESYFNNVSFGENTLVSSDPVRVYLCNLNNEQNYTHQSYSVIEVKKGQTFTLSVVAVDQISQPVSATIQTSLHFTESGVAEGQLTRRISAECTDVTFNVISPHYSENLTLYALNGPCQSAELSRSIVKMYFLPCSCPIGLQVSLVSKTNCSCECHSDIRQYVQQCDSHTGSLVKGSQSKAWISYINDSDLSGYLVYPNCPFDYCLSTSPPVDLNQPNGADAQCAFNRSSLLCGSCQSGLSLSLGSSRCLPCPNHWPALFVTITIIAILPGIVLVAFLLVLNMTVAVGTLNGLIFYANVVYVNKSIMLPFPSINFLTVFLSWLNLELGIDTCYFPGIDTYIKTWLQLAFPAYVILLVILVIIFSSYSTRFSSLIGKKNPVATLATLILLSYAKLLEICFKSLSVGFLEYPDGSNEMLWLPDATVQYLSGKHIPLFIAAVLILLVGLVYTTLLFSWQWLLYLPKWRIFRWSRNPKIQTFIETYHTPYTPKHRYWTGLLLIVRIILYLVSAVNVSNDPTVALTAIIFTICCLFALSKFFGNRLYRKWPVDVLETIFYLNILSYATFTWYTLDKQDSNQEASAYTSVMITFIVLLFIILFHVYTYTTVFSKVKKTEFEKIIDRLFTDADPKPKPVHHWNPSPDDDIHRFNELLDVIDHPVNTNDYNIPLKQKVTKPTQSVVEVHHPQLAPPDPEEVTNTQNTPGATEAVYVEMKEAVSHI